MNMEIYIPPHSGMSIESEVNLRNLEFIEKKQSKAAVHTKLVCRCTTTYAKVFNLHDVCNVLEIPEEYALKVLVGTTTNESVSACLDAIGNKHKFSIIFRSVLVIEEQHNLSAKVRINSVRSRSRSTQEAIDSADLTHPFEKLLVGNELTIIMISSVRDTRAISKLQNEINVFFKGNFGYLSSQKMLSLFKKGHGIDQLFGDMNIQIKYISLDKLDQYPPNFLGMIKTLCLFTKESDRWAKIYNRNKECKVVSGIYAITDGHERDIEVATRDRADSHSLSMYLDKKLENKMADSRDFYYIRAMLRINQDHFYCRSESLNQIAQNIQSNKESKALIARLMSSGRRLSDEEIAKGNSIITILESDIKTASDFVNKLDFNRIYFDTALQDVLKSNRIIVAKEFYKNMNTVLPVGVNLNLLLMGKSKCGKSSTGNSILGHETFSSLMSQNPVTEKPIMGWNNIDGREIKVVDTQDFCRGSTKVISDAIIYCNEGFHALILVFKFGDDITKEEQSAIKELKRVFGQNIIKTRCICIFTHGDEFTHVDEFNINKLFKKWCKMQDGFMKQLLTECDYRCVLFDNKTSNSVFKKRQTFKLIRLIDTQFGMEIFTNKLFQRTDNIKIKTDENVLKRISNLQQKFHLIMQKYDRNYEKELTEMKKDLDELKNDAKEKPNLLQIVDSLINVVNRQIHRTK